MTLQRDLVDLEDVISKTRGADFFFLLIVILFLTLGEKLRDPC
jgi:hypothetical protein